MGKSVEKSGKTVNEAISAALCEMELSIDDVHVDVLNEGKAGLFGLLSGKPARVRVSELDEDERVAQPGANTASGGAARGVGIGGDAAGGAAFDAALDLGRDEYAGGDAGADEGAGGDAGSGAVDESDAYGDDGEDEADGEAHIDYDYEIDKAVEFLSEIFKRLRISAAMDAEPAEDGIIIRIESDDSGILIGRRGETLDAFQYLVNLYMNRGRGSFIRVTVDVENYKNKREAALIRIAGQTADKVVRLRRNLALDAMNSYERRIIHATLQNHPKVETYSVGEDPNRKVVVTLKNRGGHQSRN